MKVLLKIENVKIVKLQDYAINYFIYTKNNVEIGYIDNFKKVFNIVIKYNKDWHLNQRYVKYFELLYKLYFTVYEKNGYKLEYIKNKKIF